MVELVFGAESILDRYDPKKEWDDYSNWRIAQKKISVFSCPSEPDLMNPEGGRFTSYVMLQNTNRNPGNPKLVYDKDRKMTDSNRILLIESCSANVFWTEPRDADVDGLGWSLQPKTESSGRSHGDPEISVPPVMTISFTSYLEMGL